MKSEHATALLTLHILKVPRVCLKDQIMQVFNLLEIHRYEIIMTN